MTLEALACAQDLEGSDKSRNVLPMGMKIPAEENRAGQCRVYRQHQGSASTDQPRNELITSRWMENKVSERSGVGLSWTFAHSKEFLCIPKYEKAFMVQGPKVWREAIDKKSERKWKEGAGWPSQTEERQDLIRR